MQLIVNADDLGYSPHRDRGIFQAFQDGIVTSASLIVNGASAEHAAKQAQAIGLEMGLHLNLTEGKPLTNAPSLTNFAGTMHYKMKIWEESLKEEDVQQETIAQLERFKQLTGSYPYHIDGHQHVHVAPRIAEIIAPLLQQYGVRSTRIPDQDVDKIKWLEDDVRARYNRRYATSVKARLTYAKYGISAPECIGVGLCGTQMTQHRIKACLEGMSGTVELMVHPGHNSTGETAGCGSVEDGFDDDEGRKHECTVLCEMDVTQIEMTTWGEIFGT